MFEKLYFIATIAAKDIQDALKNRIVLYQVVSIIIILVSIKGLAFIIEPPALQVVVYDPEGSSLSDILAESEEISPIQVASFEELQEVISNMGFGLGPELGLVLPPGIDQQLENSSGLEIDGYVSWANRSKADQLQTEMESALFAVTGKSIQVNLTDHIVTPPAEIGTLVGIVTIFAVTIILLIGIILVPALMLEEKQNHTLEALLVSPVSIGQVVAGKALAGSFYILVAALIVFLVYGSGVYYWGLAVLFVAGAMCFAVAVGLLFGVLFKRPQEMTGWMSLSLLLIIGTIFLYLIDLDLPAAVEKLLPYLPSVALTKIFWASFSSSINYGQILTSLGVVLVVSGVIFAVIIYRIKQLDR